MHVYQYCSSFVFTLKELSRTLSCKSLCWGNYQHCQDKLWRGDISSLNCQSNSAHFRHGKGLLCLNLDYIFQVAGDWWPACLTGSFRCRHVLTIKCYLLMLAVPVWCYHRYWFYQRNTTVCNRVLLRNYSDCLKKIQETYICILSLKIKKHECGKLVWLTLASSKYKRTALLSSVVEKVAQNIVSAWPGILRESAWATQSRMQLTHTLVKIYGSMIKPSRNGGGGKFRRRIWWVLKWAVALCKSQWRTTETRWTAKWIIVWSKRVA